MTVATNGVAVGDYLINNTRLGQEIRNTGDVIGSVQTVWEEKKQEIMDNASTFAEDWAGVFENIGGWFADHADNGAKLQEKAVEYVGGLIDKWAEENSASNSSILGKPGQLIEEWNALWGGGDNLEVPAEPVLEDDAAEKLQNEANGITIRIGTRLVPVSFGGGAGGGGGGRFGYLAEHANGLPTVPFDGYLAMLHKGEQVIPAREVSNRSFSSNMYIESMYMNNGQDAEGLAAAIAAANRRTMRGFGS